MEPDQGTSAAARSERHEVLASSRRRAVLAVLSEHEHESLTVADVADEVAVVERDRPLSAVSAEAVRDIYLTLHHVHLPKLEDAGALAYDVDRGLVRLEDGGFTDTETSDSRDGDRGTAASTD